MSIRELEPQSLWNHFADLNAVPRPSKKEEKVIEFAKSFGESLGLPTTVDEVGNVIIKKPATPGMEDRTPIVMQSHLDMVCQKNNDTVFDFDTQGIEMLVDGDFVKANGTTLGADNGIGVATIMAILSSNDIPHPAIDALFTIDEETGMTGAMGLQGGLLDGKILLNLDTEDDDELTIGCAGGVDITLTGKYEPETAQENSTCYSITVRGLKGGHSGMDIHLGRGNANKWMNRILWHLAKAFPIQIHSIDGGGLRNAIPRESVATVSIPDASSASFHEIIEAQKAELLSEYASTDPDADLAVEKAESVSDGLPAPFQNRLLSLLYTCPNGIFRMSPDIEDLIQTSNNLARVHVANGEVQIGCLTRSSVNSERDDLANAISSTFAMLADCLQDGEISFGGKYPGWAPMPDSKIVKLMSRLYEELFSEKPHVAACHAGLECGILGRNYPEMEMISFGPNIRGAHSPDEKVQISSVQKFWKYLLETLQQIPAA